LFTVPDIDRYKKQDFQYVQYSNKESIGKALAEDKKASDSRYRISYVIDSYANEFKDNRSHALDLMLPKTLYMQKFADPKTFAPSSTAVEAPKIKLPDDPELMKFLLPDYYLN
jgi:hypothetical protein